MAEIWWSLLPFVLSFVLLFLAASCISMAREPSFSIKERIVGIVFGFCLCWGIFFWLTQLVGLSANMAGSIVILASLAGWFKPELVRAGEKILKI